MHDAPSLLASLPFALLLGAIAVLPLIPRTAHWWERNRSKLLVSLILGALVVVHYAARGWGYHGSAPGGSAVVAVLEHALLRDYLPFLILLFSLYVIAGGIRVDGDLRATPSVNTAILAIGAVAASFVGTTGASMVLIRPLLQTNSERRRVTHTVVFFIFLVSNVGGCLLPIGDPPLFMGYLQGVPFFWTLRLVLPWLFASTVLLVVYYAWDRRVYRGESVEAIAADRSTLVLPRLTGRWNFLWLGGVVATVALVVPGEAIPGTDIVPRDFVREAILLGFTGLSLLTTPRGLRSETSFGYGPIVEVACLFLGIFLTMQPALEILQAKGPSLGLDSPASFFWATGGLSGVLDNAPTYLAFLEVAKTLPPRSGAAVVQLLGDGAVDSGRLAAISLGAVFLGAMTYIGNGPNLMVKAIAESRGVTMPSFFGYVVYSLAILLPVLMATAWLFVR